MTISTTNSSSYLAGTGTQYTFNYSFIADQASDVSVYYIDADSNQTLLSPTQYTLVINAASPNQLWGVGGTVTYPLAGAAIATGTYLFLQRALPLTQEISVRNQGNFYAKVTEQALDILEMQIQQVAARTGQLRGIWATGIQYNFGDVVVDGVNGNNTGNYYMCVIGNLSSVWANELAAGDWSIAIDVQAINKVVGNYLPLIGGTVTGNLIVEGAITGNVPNVYNIANYGASSSLPDNTPAIQSAINTAQAAGGGTIFFPPGTWTCTGTLFVTGSNITFLGFNTQGTVINFNNSTLDCISVQGTSATAIQGFQLKNISLNHTSKGGGRTLILAYVNYITIRDVFVNNCWTGFELWVNNTVTIDNVTFQGVSGGSSVPTSHFGSYAPLACYGIWWHAPGDGTFNSTPLTLINVTIQALFSGADGIVWDGFATTMNGNQVTCLGCRYGMHILNNASSNAYYPQFASMYNFNTDGISAIGLYIEAGALMYFTDASLQNTSGSSGQGSADTNAVKILGDTSASFTNSIQFKGGRIGLSKTEAISIAARNVSLIGVSFEPGSTQTTNTQAAIRLLSPAQDISIVACQTFEFGEPVHWKYGLLIDAGVLRVVGGLNNFSQASTKEVQNNASDSQSLMFGNNSSQSGSVNPCSIGLANATTVTGNYTETGSNLVGGILELTGTPGAFNLTTPTAAQIVSALQSPMINSQVQWFVINASNGIATILAGAGVTFSGVLSSAHFVIAAAAVRDLRIFITNTTSGSESVTIYG